ncbi:hypothetical protein PUN28_017856 [Cardiocondyla obscurior]|uniref:Uncharacterized protein n=1 Tax=Cardiocondyla obscurior TaxID=286306 RepID=A0AAW2EN24_9HYME
MSHFQGVSCNTYSKKPLAISYRANRIAINAVVYARLRNIAKCLVALTGAQSFGVGLAGAVGIARTQGSRDSVMWTIPLDRGTLCHPSLVAQRKRPRPAFSPPGALPPGAIYQCAIKLKS